jgi:hypothetical protein
MNGEIRHNTARRRSTYPVSAVADTFCLRTWRQMQQLLLRHRSTPPDVLARDHDRQQVSWLAGLGPSSQRPFGPQRYLWSSTNRLQLRGQRGIAYLNTRTAFPWLAFAGTTTRDCARDRDPSQPSNLSHLEQYLRMRRLHRKNRYRSLATARSHSQPPLRLIRITSDSRYAAGTAAKAVRLAPVSASNEPPA